MCGKGLTELLAKQALWNICLPTARKTSRGLFDMKATKEVHQADFFPFTIVNAAKRYNEAETWISKDSVSVAHAQKKLFAHIHDNKSAAVNFSESLQHCVAKASGRLPDVIVETKEDTKTDEEEEDVIINGIQGLDAGANAENLNIPQLPPGTNHKWKKLSDTLKISLPVDHSESRVFCCKQIPDWIKQVLNIPSNNLINTWAVNVLGKQTRSLVNKPPDDLTSANILQAWLMHQKSLAPNKAMDDG
ncbi:hypothetical protein CHS0354_034840 [Potamilus streckersoni]|uniref:Uncharacterized protein n=1 Tax=Potamilus streckersoni TaxID=2493646 RepID=A0AAE0WDK5_9BIVA|nr:hypothetical protein CHS0354_034840 [Potamilus streckersoni]